MTCIMTHVAELADTIDLDVGSGKKDQLTRLGPSMWGYIYQSKKRPACYRLIPMSEASIERRDLARQWMDKPRKRAVAPIVNIGQIFLNGTPFFFIEYEIAFEQSWVHIINSPKIPFDLRLQYAILILREFSKWRSLLNNNSQDYLLPMPADIVFLDSVPHLLAIPCWGKLDVEALFAEPQRSLYIAPEYIRGCDNQIWGSNIDIYAIGASICQCVYQLSATEYPERLLTRIATSTLLRPQSRRTRLPFWLEKVDICEELLADIRQTIHPDLRIRSSVDPARLANRLSLYIQNMKPEVLIESLIGSGRPEDALALLQNILFEQNSYDHLVKAAQIAEDHLGRTLEAIDLLERAIDLEPKVLTAYDNQLKLLLLLAISKKNFGMTGDQIDIRIWRNFEAISTDRKQNYEVELANYLLLQHNYKKAAEFIYSRLLDGQKYLWWKFDLTIAYAKSLLETGQYDDATAQINNIKHNLNKVRQNRTLTDYEVNRYGSMVAEIEVDLFKRRKSASQ